MACAVPRFREREVRPLLFVVFRESLRELLEVRAPPRSCTSFLQAGTCGSQAS